MIHAAMHQYDPCILPLAVHLGEACSHAPYPAMHPAMHRGAGRASRSLVGAGEVEGGDDAPGWGSVLPTVEVAPCDGGS